MSILVIGTHGSLFIPTKNLLFLACGVKSDGLTATIRQQRIRGDLADESIFVLARWKKSQKFVSADFSKVFQKFENIEDEKIDLRSALREVIRKSNLNDDPQTVSDESKSPDIIIVQGVEWEKIDSESEDSEKELVRNNSEGTLKISSDNV